MKLIITISILLFTVIDFLSASSEVSELTSHCEKQEKIETENCHSHADSEEQDHSDGSCHCDCHIGHIHNAVIVNLVELFQVIELNKNKSFPKISQLNIQNYYSRINRPPIA